MASFVIISGVKELQDALLDLGPKVANKIATRGMRAGAEVIMSKARALVPYSDVSHPHLRDSIVSVMQPNKNTGTRTLTIGFLHPASRHAGFVEYGNSHQAPEPFMRPAIDTVGQTAIDVMGEIMGEDIEAAASGYPLGRAP